MRLGGIFLEDKSKKTLAIIFLCLSLFTILNVVITEVFQGQYKETRIEYKEATSAFLDSEFANFETIEYEDLIPKIQNREIGSSLLCNGYLYITTINGEEYRIMQQSNLLSYLLIYGIDTQKVNIEGAPTVTQQGVAKGGGWRWAAAGVALLIACIMYYALVYSPEDKKVFAEVMNNGNEVRRTSTVKTIDGSEETVPRVHFSDVEGIEELKSDIERIVDCLKNKEKYKRMGARIPKGVILYGPPGTGKTLIAKAIDGEADVPFFSAIGSDFVEMYVGMGAKRVRELYKKAKKEAPCIVFIDEIDAVAGQRGGHDNSERDQTINALLGELDGFDGSEGVITICATNRLDMLDDAFKRAGRFDLKLAVGLPDRDSRLKILKIHARNKILNEEVSIEDIASRTVGFSGAELETLLNEAALNAANKNKESITMEDIEDSFFKIVMQGNKKKRTEVNKELQVVAYHETGHTIASKLLAGDSVSSVTVVQSSSGAGGVTFRQPVENGLKSKKYLENLIKTMYAGRAAEEIFLGSTDEITTGASQDIKQATQIIKEYLAIYGMGETGMLDLSQFSSEYNVIIEEASELAKRLYQETLDFLNEHFLLLTEMSSVLLAKETLSEAEIDEIIEKIEK